MKRNIIAITMLSLSTFSLAVEKTVMWKFDCARVNPKNTSNILIERATLSIPNRDTINIVVHEMSNCSGCRESYKADLSSYVNTSAPLSGKIGYQSRYRTVAAFNGENIVGGEIFYIDTQLLNGEAGNLVYVDEDNNGGKTTTVLFCR